MKLEHIAINVPEPAAFAQWLVDNLGMRIILAKDESPYMHFVADEAGSMLELYSNPAAPTPMRTVRASRAPYTFCSNPGDTMKAGTRKNM